VVDACIVRLVAEKLGYVPADETQGFQIDEKRVQFAMRRLQRTATSRQPAAPPGVTYNIQVTNSTVAALAAGNNAGATGTVGNRRENKGPQTSTAASPTSGSDTSTHRVAATRAADRLTITAFDAIINSDWMANWQETQLTYPQYVRRNVLDSIQQYDFEAGKPENVFYDTELETAHRAFVRAMQNYLSVSARERVPDRVSANTYVISMKQLGGDQWFDDYDERYEKQISAITHAVERAWDAWGTYVRLAKLLRAQVP